jgi:hypothetical protein
MKNGANTLADWVVGIPAVWSGSAPPELPWVLTVHQPNQQIFRDSHHATERQGLTPLCGHMFGQPKMGSVIVIQVDNATPIILNR